jgi:hypothetical protein
MRSVGRMGRMVAMFEGAWPYGVVGDGGVKTRVVGGLADTPAGKSRFDSLVSDASSYHSQTPSTAQDMMYT